MNLENKTYARFKELLGDTEYTFTFTCNPEVTQSFFLFTLFSLSLFSFSGLITLDRGRALYRFIMSYVCYVTTHGVSTMLQIVNPKEVPPLS